MLLYFYSSLFSSSSEQSGIKKNLYSIATFKTVASTCAAKLHTLTHKEGLEIVVMATSKIWFKLHQTSSKYIKIHTQCKLNQVIFGLGQNDSTWRCLHKHVSCSKKKKKINKRLNTHFLWFSTIYSSDTITSWDNLFLITCHQLWVKIEVYSKISIS